MPGSADNDSTSTHDSSAISALLDAAGATDDDGQTESKAHSSRTQVAQTLSPAIIEDDMGSSQASNPLDVKHPSTTHRANVAHDRHKQQQQQQQPQKQQSSMSIAPHADLKPWPKIHSPNREDPLLLKTAAISRETINSPSPPHHHLDRRPSLNNRASSAAIVTSSTSTPAATEQPYYESSRQPLSVSQQTSASAVRDMALRKGSPSVLKKDRSTEQRPLKSALKPFVPSKRGETVPLPAPTYFVMSPALQQKERSRFARFSNLLSRTGSGNTDRSAMFSPLSRNPSTTSAHSDRKSPSKGLRQKRSIGWDKPLHQFDDSRNNSVQSDVSDRVRQAKLAEGDVYEKAKMNIRRPPKGIQNWFDGFGISSDEDDVTPLAEPQHSRSQQSNARQHSFEQESRSSQSRQANLPPKVERMLGHSVPATRPDHDSLHDRLVPADNANRYETGNDDYFRFRERTTTPKAQLQVYRSTEYPSSQHTSTNSHASSYNDTSTDRSDQYYRGSDHYSSNSEAVINRASAIDLRRPAIPPRKMQAVQTSSNQPWHGETMPQLTSYASTTTRPPLQSHHSSSKFSSQSQKTIDDEHDGRSSGFHSHNASTTPKRGARASTRFSSSLAQSDSTGGVPLGNLEAELQHTMAVTEEEMALLEMMRNKRAAMNRGNFPRGYRKQLEREHEQLMQRRLLAQQTALKILRDQQQFYAQRSETEETNDTTDGEEDEREIMRLDKLRMEELNRTLRLEKFLASNVSLAAALQETGLHRAEPQLRTRSSKQSQRPRLGTRTPSNQHEEDRAKIASRSESRSMFVQDGYVSPQDFPSPPAYTEDRHDRKKNRSSMKSTRHLATLDEDERLTAAFERAQRKSRTLLANHAIDDEIVQQELNRLRSQLQHRSQTSPELGRKKQAPTFLQSISDYQSADYRSITSRGTSVNASAVSPLTPSSLEPREGEKHAGFGPIDSDDELRYAMGDSSSPELNFSKPSRGVSVSTTSTATRRSKHKQQYPSALAMIADEERRAVRDSLESSGSAGGDVLAAWAELGGAEGSLPGRRPLAR